MIDSSLHDSVLVNFCHESSSCRAGWGVRCVFPVECVAVVDNIAIGMPTVLVDRKFNCSDLMRGVGLKVAFALSS